MLSNEPRSVSYSKLVRLDVVRCQRLKDWVWPRTESRKMGHWSYPIPEGGKRMTLIELPIKMSKTAPATMCTFQTDWNLKMLYFSSGDPYATHRPTYSPEYGCYTMIATNMQYFFSMPSGSFVLDHTRLDKGGGSTEGEQCTSTRQMYQVTGCNSL